MKRMYKYAANTKGGTVGQTQRRLKLIAKIIVVFGNFLTEQFF